MALPLYEQFAQVMEHLCSHDGDSGHGYSQDARWGDGTWETIYLSDGTPVAIQNGDRDCSSSEISALEAIGIDCHGAGYTGNMRECLLATGLFEWYPMSVPHYAQRGDIYLNEAKHTAMCTSSDPDMLCHFSIAENGTIYGRQGDQTGRESCFREYYDKPWDGRLCWKDRTQTSVGGSSEPVSTPADDLDTVAWRVIDGEYGDVPGRYVKLQIEGFDPQTVQDRVNELLGYSGPTNSAGEIVTDPSDQNFAKYWGTVVVRRGDSGKVVEIIQNALVAHGYDIGRWGVDGDFGGDTDSAVRKFQRDRGLKDDGEVGAKTASCLFD